MIYLLRPRAQQEQQQHMKSSFYFLSKAKEKLKILVSSNGPALFSYFRENLLRQEDFSIYTV